MALQTREIVWILFIVILAISVLHTDAASRRRTRYSYRSSSSSSSGVSSGGGMIALIVFGVITVIIIVVVVIRCYWAKKHGQTFWKCSGKNKTNPVKDTYDESSVVTTTNYPTGQAMPPPPPPAYSDPAYPPQKY